jgi:diguanylate cyclase (GGDEF)-like protein
MSSFQKKNSWSGISSLRKRLHRSYPNNKKADLKKHRIKLDKKSIVYRVTLLVIILIVAQAILLSVFLILGGVLGQARQNAYTTFSDKVKNRNESLQRELNIRWTNLDPYQNQITKLLSAHKDTDQYLSDISEYLMSILRSTQSTGAFVILQPEDSGQDYPSLYFRDYDPVLNDYGNKDLYMVVGPAEIAKKLQIPLDQMWKYKMNMANMVHPFYDEPYQNADLSHYSNLLGYWSLPFQLFPEDIPVITYTEPLLSKNDEVMGVIGVEISIQYFKQFLPSTELQARDSLGYFIGYKNEESEGIEPILFTRAIQNQILKSGSELSYTKVDSEENIFLLDNHKGKNDIYLCIEEMDLYSDNTPFQVEQWYIIGMMSGNSLLYYVNQLQNIILFSLISSILIGIVGGYLVSYRFTKPIILLANKVKNSDMSKKLALEKTGLTEVDELSLAIQTANDSLLESTIKMSRIIDLAELAIGAFEYRADSNYVFVTDQLMSILSIIPEEMVQLREDKLLFRKRIQELLINPIAEEENVFILPGHQPKWVKLKEVNTDKFTIGVVTDVTDEMIEKLGIIRERDFDYLTQIYNRQALHRVGEEILATLDKNLEAAILMFDLDNLKDINDTYGHEWGDRYLKLVVKHLNSISDDRMMLGRRSGDEFIVFLYNSKTRDEIRLYIDRFYHELSRDLLRLPDGMEKPIYISSGLVWVNDFDFTYDEFLKCADEALYQAKKNRKGTCCEYHNIIDEGK